MAENNETLNTNTPVLDSVVAEANSKKPEKKEEKIMKAEEVKVEVKVQEEEIKMNKTVKEEILSRLTINKDGKLMPNRSDIEAEVEKSILDQEFRIRESGEYKQSKLSDLSTSDEKESEAEEISSSLIKHTDGYMIGGKIIPTVACKTVTEVLDELREGKYLCLKFGIMLDRTDSETVESNLKNFKPEPVHIPMGRTRNRLENGLIVVEPSVNGFNISALFEESTLDIQNRLQKLFDWVDELHACILEDTVKRLHEEGAMDVDIISSQAAVGLVPRARRRYEQNLMKSRDLDHVTPDIRESSKNFADQLNDHLAILPLTGQAIRFGFQLYTIEVTTKSAKDMKWSSSRDNISYFTKGNVNGRIVRISSNYTKVPLFATRVRYYLDKLESFIPAVLTSFENMVRIQLGLGGRISGDIELPALDERNYDNAAELLGVERSYVRKIENELSDKVNKMLKDDDAKSELKQIKSLLQSLGLPVEKLD